MSSSNAPMFIDWLLHHYSPGATVYRNIWAAFAAIAWYNAIELMILCFVSFKRRHGCYFWSLLVASASLFPQVLGWVLFFFTDVSPYICVSLVLFSWYGMVTGQSMVLWSRLHLVLQNTKILSVVLWMIVVDAILFHVPPTVLFYGRVASPSSALNLGYSIVERVQLVGFCLQEMIISGIYIWETANLLRLRPQGRPQKILYQLLAINIAILILDISVVVMEYAGFYGIQVMFKPVAYSIKLKLEYAILGRLVAIARGPGNLPSRDSDISSFSTLQNHDPPTHMERSCNV
ncbi:hypothetical protein HFD88_004863 [Aspergillus terreus]|nr:hypothetical protein HFD88_004863 [Aspergillus terreus]